MWKINNSIFFYEYDKLVAVVIKSFYGDFENGLIGYDIKKFTKDRNIYKMQFLAKSVFKFNLYILLNVLNLIIIDNNNYFWEKFKMK